MNSGGIILADNVLWSRKILDDENKMDDDTKLCLTSIKNNER